MKKNAAKIKIKVSDRGAICLELIDSKLAYTANRFKVHIINYITCFNKFAEENILKPESTAFGNGKSCIAYLSYYSFTDLFSNTRGLYKMDDIDLEEYAAATDKDRRTALDAPTIHMTLGNILSDEDNPIDEPFKRFARYMDSSIWNYYAPIIVKVDLTIPHGLNPNRYDFSYFIFAIQAIINNSFYKTPQGITNLYEINVTKEYADINERILMQSKLMEVSGHSKNVSPFLFHSEQKLQKEIAKGHENLIENIICKPTDEETIKLYEENGVKIEDYITKPAKVKILKTDSEKDISRLQITIPEGKNRQVRKMCEAVGRKVQALHRSKIGNIDVKDLNCDLLSASGHKFGAPKGIGFLYVKKNGPELDRLIVGGKQEQGLRGGTENVLGIVAMAAAIEDAVEHMQERNMYVKN